MAEREHGDDEAAGELALVLERSPYRPVGGAERHTGGKCAGGVCGGVVEHSVEEIRRDDLAAVRSVERVERHEHDHAVGVAECGLDDGEAVLGRGVRCRTDERRAPRRSVAGERGGEERDGRVVEPSERSGRAAGGARLVERRDDAADDFRRRRRPRPYGIECCGPDRRVRIVEERGEQAAVGADPRGRPPRRDGRRGRRSA